MFPYSNILSSANRTFFFHGEGSLEVFLSWVRLTWIDQNPFDLPRPRLPLGLLPPKDHKGQNPKSRPGGFGKGTLPPAPSPKKPVSRLPVPDLRDGHSQHPPGFLALAVLIHSQICPYAHPDHKNRGWRGVREQSPGKGEGGQWFYSPLSTRPSFLTPAPYPFENGSHST